MCIYVYIYYTYIYYIYIYYMCIIVYMYRTRNDVSQVFFDGEGAERSVVGCHSVYRKS